MREIRGAQIGMIFQDAELPSVRCAGWEVRCGRRWAAHEGRSQRRRREQALELGKSGVFGGGADLGQLSLRAFRRNEPAGGGGDGQASSANVTSGG